MSICCVLSCMLNCFLVLFLCIAQVGIYILHIYICNLDVRCTLCTWFIGGIGLFYFVLMVFVFCGLCYYISNTWVAVVDLT